VMSLGSQVEQVPLSVICVCLVKRTQSTKLLNALSFSIETESSVASFIEYSK
jgi:hypothetical protein